MLYFFFKCFSFEACTCFHFGQLEFSIDWLTEVIYQPKIENLNPKIKTHSWNGTEPKTTNQKRKPAALVQWARNVIQHVYMKQTTVVTRRTANQNQMTKSIFNKRKTPEKRWFAKNLIVCVCLCVCDRSEQHTQSLTKRHTIGSGSNQSIVERDSSTSRRLGVLSKDLMRIRSIGLRSPLNAKNESIKRVEGQPKLEDRFWTETVLISTKKL